MTDAEKLLWMFQQVEKIQFTNSKVSVIVAEDASKVSVIESGVVCWEKSKIDIIFDYLTKRLD